MFKRRRRLRSVFRFDLASKRVQTLPAPKKTGNSRSVKTRGCSNTKIHAIVSNSSLAVAASLSAGILPDAPQDRALVKSIAGRFSGSSLLMDKVYEGDRTRNCGVDCGMIPVVPPKKNRLEPWDHDKELYKQRNEVERFFRRLKRFRRVGTQYEKLDKTYLAMIHLALAYDSLACCVNSP